MQKHLPGELWLIIRESLNLEDTFNLLKASRLSRLGFTRNELVRKMSFLEIAYTLDQDLIHHKLSKMRKPCNQNENNIAYRWLDLKAPGIIYQEEYVTRSLQYKVAKYACKHGIIDTLKSVISDMEIMHITKIEKLSWIASKYGHIEILRYLIEKFGSRSVIYGPYYPGHYYPNYEDHAAHIHRPIDMAIRHGHIHVIKLFLDKGDKIDYDDAIDILYENFSGNIDKQMKMAIFLQKTDL